MPPPRPRGTARPTGRWLAYAIPGVLLLITLYQGIFKDSIDIGLLGALIVFGFGAFSWRLDDVLGDRVAGELRSSVADTLEGAARTIGGERNPADAGEVRDHTGDDDARRA